MKLREMFQKDIDRNVKGVIKVAQKDESDIVQELEEYVVTNELKEHFKNFYEAYYEGIVGFTDKMGVWISGFFGSGKSHFLKILSYLLENREVKARKAIDYFTNKIDDNSILELIKGAGEVSTDVILFNIDSKSGSDSKADKDAIVKVFMKVFNDHLGYCGDIPWLAELERKMDKEEVYEDFKVEFKEITGDSWEERRHDFYYEEVAIIEALAKTTKMNQEAAKNWYYNAENNYSLSIEKFAQLVEKYIQSQGDNHHLVFLVDEIGQYIGDDNQLMLNLQTVVEDLGIHCGGKAWVLVTSQEDIDSITEVRGGDFSKIQGRFDTRLSLSSANVDEVIKKRILEKRDSARESLKLLYDEKSSILNNLITFSSDTAEMKNYNDGDNFADIYPFIPYQFDLLQQVFEEVRLKGASGKHLAEGERSLLSAFQESAQIYADDELAKLIPFSSFYNSIESFLDANISRVITKAKNNSRLNEMDVEVLKVLFMIKYLNQIPSNLSNITTLLISHIDEDKLALQEKVEESLKRLYRETLIQKNGDQYIFLTNEEQDINREIKNTKIETGEVINKVGEVVFEEIYDNKKYRYSKEYDFSFNQIVDDKYRGSQRAEIALQVLTPYSDYTGKSEQELRLMSTGEDNLIVKLPEESETLAELSEALHLETYLKRRGGNAPSKEIENIINLKSRELRIRQKRIKKLLVKDLVEADIYVRGEKLDFKSNDPAQRINEGFNFLVENIYHKLNYMEEFSSSKQELRDRIARDKVQFTLSEEAPNQLALDEVQMYIEGRSQRNLRTTVKGLIDRFSSIPYGWKDYDIVAVLIDLFKVQEIKISYNDQQLKIDNDRLVDYLTGRRYIESVVITKREKVEPSLINAAKNLARDVFKRTALSTDEDSLIQEIKREIKQELEEINKLLKNYQEQDYPGQEVLRAGKREFKFLLNTKDVFNFFNELAAREAKLLDYEEKAERVKSFFDNQKEHYDNALKALDTYRQNESYILDEELIEIIEDLKGIVNSAEPYAEIYRIPDLRDRFNNKLIKLLKEKVEPIKEVIKNNRLKIITELSAVDLAEEVKVDLKSEFRGKFKRLLDRLESTDNFNEIISMNQESEMVKRQCLQKIQNKLELKREAGLKEKAKEDIKSEEQIKETLAQQSYKVVKTINFASILTETRVIENDEDIEDLLADIKAKIKSELSEEQKVKLI